VARSGKAAGDGYPDSLLQGRTAAAAVAAAVVVVVAMRLFG